ncbi:MAG: hypothetical protein QXG03_10700 [Halalkalicoccus sp.]
MDRRELLATGGVSLVAIAGCLGTYEVARRTVLPPDDSAETTDESTDDDPTTDDPLADDDGPLADEEADDADEAGDESQEPETDDDGPLADEEAEEDDDQDDSDDDEEPADVPEERPDDPIEHITWLDHDVEIIEQAEEHGGDEVFVIGEVRNDTGYDLSYLLIAAQGLLDGEIITENEIEIAGLPADETLTFEIPLFVEPEEIDEYRYGVWDAEYAENEE